MDAPNPPPLPPPPPRYEDLLKLNVEAYVAALESKGEDLALATVKAEIKQHSAELEQLQEAIPPSGISLGLAFVNTSKVGSSIP